jgi:uncharacterized protein YneF (UPF0154 family)
MTTEVIIGLLAGPVFMLAGMAIVFWFASKH